MACDCSFGKRQALDQALAPLCRDKFDAYFMTRELVAAGFDMKKESFLRAMIRSTSRQIRRVSMLETSVQSSTP